jgi:chemotaxis protein methyltransferase CheR
MIDVMITDKIREIIKNQTGIVINNDRLLDLEIVLQSRFIKNKMKAEDYLEFLQNNYDEIIILASNFTIQETSFYRNKAHFDRLKFRIFPDLLEKKLLESNKEILILSAGCATGEEPYTLAMILFDSIHDIKEWDIRIIGTDINADVLDFAKRGVYTKYKLRNIDSWYIDRFFTTRNNKQTTLYELNPEIKNMIEFRQCNLIREPFELSDLYNVDVILCENVIIYFNHESIQRLIDNFYSILKDKGFLFLGYSETLNLVEHKYILSWWQDSFAYQKNESITQKKQQGISPYLNPKKKRALPEELAGLYKKSYEEIIYLLIQNCDEKNVDNCIILLETLETSTIKTDESFYIIKAEYLVNRKKYIDAANACRKAISVNPYFVDAHIMLGYIYLEITMLESAEFELKTALYIEKTSILAWYFYAQYNRKSGDVVKYNECMKKARSLYAANNYKFKTKLFPLNKNIQHSISGMIMNADQNENLF